MKLLAKIFISVLALFNIVLYFENCQPVVFNIIQIK
jgi:hypothetical protein